MAQQPRQVQTEARSRHFLQAFPVSSPGTWAVFCRFLMHISRELAWRHTSLDSNQYSMWDRGDTGDGLLTSCTTIQTGTEEKISHPLVYSPHAFNSQHWARLKQGVRNSVQELPYVSYLSRPLLPPRTHFRRMLESEAEQG